MDFFLSGNEDIPQLPITEKERNHHSRSRYAYHVFLSFYFMKYGELDRNGKVEFLTSVGVWSSGYESDDSVITPPMPSAIHVMKAASRTWQRMGTEVQNQWKERAELLNSRPPSDGRIRTQPDFITEADVAHSITMEWRHLAQLLRRTVLSGHNAERALTSYRFGEETVILHAQKYRSFYFNHLLKLTIFGSPLFSNLLPHEIVHRSNNQALVLLYSHERAEELFEVGGLSGATIYKNKMKYIMCAKVNMKKDRLNKIAMVLEESGEEIHCRALGDHETTYIFDRPAYEYESGTFSFSDRISHGFQLNEIWPIRLKINTSSASSIILTGSVSDVDCNEHI